MIARHLRGEAVERADWHRTQGHRLVIVSASLAAYLRPIAERLRFDAVLATELEVGDDGRLTGRMDGANVRGPEKARRLDEWLAASSRRVAVRVGLRRQLRRQGALGARRPRGPSRPARPQGHGLTAPDPRRPSERAGRRPPRLRGMSTLSAERVPEVDAPASPRRFAWGLAIIVVGALAVRFTWVLVARRDFSLHGDDFFYHWQANALAEGKGFLNPFVVAGGRHGQAERRPSSALLVLPLGLLVVRASTRPSTTGWRRASSASPRSWWSVSLGRRVAGDRAGLIAAGLAAVYPQLWINDGMLISESMYVLVRRAHAALRVPRLGLAALDRCRAARCRDRGQRARRVPRPSSSCRSSAFPYLFARRATFESPARAWSS